MFLLHSLQKGWRCVLKEEIETLYIEQYQTLLMYAMQVLQNEALAEEAVQETFRIACQRAEILQKSVNRQGWLFNTLKYVISNIKRMQSRSNRLLAEYFSHEEDDYGKADSINLDILYEDIAGMDEFYLIKQIALEQKPIRELAEELGISVDACKKRVERARKRLRKLIE